MSQLAGEGDIKIDQSVWLTSYSDLVSLLLVFFVIMISPQAVTTQAMQQAKQELDQAISALRKEIEKNHLENEVDVSVLGNSATISLRDNLLFEPGKAAISPEHQAIITMLIATLNSAVSTHRISIEGHTDNLPINNPTFRSNWYLSSSRALAVLDLFIEAGFPQEKLSAQGFSQYSPLAPNMDEAGNDSPENRRRNRRVVIRVL